MHTNFVILLDGRQPICVESRVGCTFSLLTDQRFFESKIFSVQGARAKHNLFILCESNTEMGEFCLKKRMIMYLLQLKVRRRDRLDEMQLPFLTPSSVSKKVLWHAEKVSTFYKVETFLNSAIQSSFKKYALVSAVLPCSSVTVMRM